MASQLVHVLDPALIVELLHRGEHPRMQLTPPVLQESGVRDLMGEGMFERVLGLREETNLVEELGRLKMGEASSEVLVTFLGDRRQERERHVLADDSGRLE